MKKETDKPCPGPRLPKTDLRRKRPNIDDRRSGWVYEFLRCNKLKRKSHFVDGRLHDDGDEPAQVDSSGTIRHYQHGKLHRVGGPAIIYANGTEVYYENNKRHRLDGPAVYRPGGKSEFWIRGKIVWK